MKLAEEMAFTTAASDAATPEMTTDERFVAFLQTIGGQVLLVAIILLALAIFFSYPLANEIRRVFGQRYKYGRQREKAVIAKDVEISGPFSGR